MGLPWRRCSGQGPYPVKTLEPRRFSRVASGFSKTTGISGFLLGWPWDKKGEIMHKGLESLKNAFLTCSLFSRDCAMCFHIHYLSHFSKQPCKICAECLGYEIFNLGNISN